MARQLGNGMYSGRIGNLIHYQVGGKALTRGYTSPVPALMKTEGWPRSLKTFAQSVNTSKNLRKVLRPLIKKFENHQIAQRFNGIIQRVKSSDPINAPKDRKVTYGNLSFFNGFEFSKEEKLKTYLEDPPKVKQEGSLIQIKHEVYFKKLPKEVSHFKVGYYLLMFEDTWEFCDLYPLHESELLPYDEEAMVSYTFEESFNIAQQVEGVKAPVVGMLLYSLETFEEVNQFPYELFDARGLGICTAWRTVNY